jgi:hypothetical protein
VDLEKKLKETELRIACIVEEKEEMEWVRENIEVGLRSMCGGG